MNSGDKSLAIDIVEVGGSGGVFQHSLAVSVALGQIGHSVRLHTSTEPEFSDPRVEVVSCFEWFRSVGRARNVLIVWFFLVRTIPHVMRCPGQVWIQGSFKPLLTLLMMVGLRAMGRRVIFSPHTLFTRHGGRLDQALLNLCVKVSSEVVVYNSSDFDRLSRRRGGVSLAPLLMYTPVVSAGVEDYWRARIREMGAQVCSIGQIRTDKNLPMLVRAAAAAGTPLLVVGADAGGAAALQREVLNVPEGSCSLVIEYLPLEDLAAIVALVGTVALPYSIASSSAVAVLAQAYGSRVLAHSVGGLAGQADVIVQSLSDADWAEAIGSNASKAWDGRIPSPKGPSQPELRQLLAIVKGLPT